MSEKLSVFIWDGSHQAKSIVAFVKVIRLVKTSWHLSKLQQHWTKSLAENLQGGNLFRCSCY